MSVCQLVELKDPAAKGGYIGLAVAAGAEPALVYDSSETPLHKPAMQPNPFVLSLSKDGYCLEKMRS